MKKYIALALFAGSSCAYRIKSKFATGMNGDEDLGEDIIMKGEPYHYNQKIAQPSSFLQTDSRWIELPDCGVIVAGDEQVALKDDLSNAVFATCKSYNPAYTPPVPTPPGPTREQIYQMGWGSNYTYWVPDPIYDPIFHTSEILYDKEHQIVQHQDGHVDPTDGLNGPKGDWYMYGKPLVDTEWPQEHIAQDYVQIFADSEDPSDISVIQFAPKKNEAKEKWVELPACDGSPGEK